jgi:ribosomal protein S27AE
MPDESREVHCLRCGVAILVATGNGRATAPPPALCPRCAAASLAPHPRWTDARWFAGVADAGGN